LAPGGKVVLFQLAIRRETIESELKLESNLFIHTNISTVSISLLCYNGRLIKVSYNTLHIVLRVSRRNESLQIKVGNIHCRARQENSR
jgi:hypothetical protein